MAGRPIRNDTLTPDAVTLSLRLKRPPGKQAHAQKTRYGQGMTLRLSLLLSLIVLAACPTKPVAPASQPPELAHASSKLDAEETAEAPVAVPAPEPVPMTVYFLNERNFATGEFPFERAVERTRLSNMAPAQAVVDAYFAGPNDDERAQGLVALTNGLTGAEVERAGETVHVRTRGVCETNGAAYNVGSLLVANLLSIDGIKWVKIYAPGGDTQQPEGPGHSIPLCMEP